MMTGDGSSFVESAMRSAITSIDSKVVPIIVLSTVSGSNQEHSKKYVKSQVSKLG